MVQPTNQEVWESASEGFSGLEEAVVTVANAYFEKRSGDYGDRVSLTLECSIDQAIDPSDFKFDTFKIFLSVGKGENWMVVDGGEKIVQAKEGASMGNSAYQQWISRCIKELKVPLAERGLSPYVAKVWTGLKFHIKRETKEIPQRLRREGSDRTTTTVTLPQRWLQDTMPPLS